ncbi:uncharacterized protein LOC34622832 [Cyclospora cayetanensis]|uniref:Uncharacterized protein LOC34622832 n=1 Tax=Cyclospora cayetanensis TaxID=88456 RepID=A0A6P6S0L2_9EIME|nr:uncharacterized protein LOC34622832 [Cyclospora cayetanensis]
MLYSSKAHWPEYRLFSCSESCGRIQICHSGLNEKKEILEALETATTDGVSCFKTIVDSPPQEGRWAFLHELQSIRQGLLIYAASQKVLTDLVHLTGVSSNVKPGNRVKLLDKYKQAGERVFTVSAVNDNLVTLQDIDHAVDLKDTIVTGDPIEVGFVDTTLTNKWKNLEREDPVIFSKFLEFASDHGYGEALESARRTAKLGSLLQALAENSDVIEILQIILKHHAFPACLSLNTPNLMTQDSLLLARLLEMSTVGSRLMSPVVQSPHENPVSKVILSPGATPMHTLDKNTALEEQCLVGTFTELGLNAAAMDGLSCRELWSTGEARKQIPSRLILVSHYCSRAMLRGVQLQSKVIIQFQTISLNGFAELIPQSLMKQCNQTCLVKASLREGWLNKNMKKQRKKYKLSHHYLRIGDAVRMTTHYSRKEIIELDKRVAAAWEAARLLLVSTEEQAEKLLAAGQRGPESAALASSVDPNEQEGEIQGSQSTAASAVASASPDTQTTSFLEDGRKKQKSKARQLSVTTQLPPFITGGDVNVNTLNFLVTARVSKRLSETELLNPALLASGIFEEIRGYVSDAGAGLENTKKQRNLAKDSDVFSAIYKVLTCGFEGDLLPPTNAPYASVALQVAGFLRVELEESKSFPWEKVVQATGDGAFKEKQYAAAAKHLKAKAQKFINLFTPCVTVVDDAAQLLKLPDRSKTKARVAKKLKNVFKHRRKTLAASPELCKNSGELHQLSRMLVTWWVHGSAPRQEDKEGHKHHRTVADTFKSARLLFASFVFQNGHDQKKIATEIFQAGCAKNKFSVPDGWALKASKQDAGSLEVSFADIKKGVDASLMYLTAHLGFLDISDWSLPMRAAQELADACGKHAVVPMDMLIDSAAGNILKSYQCIILQNEGIKVLTQAFGKSAKAVDKAYLKYVFTFLASVHAWKGSSRTKHGSLVDLFKKYEKTPTDSEKQDVLAQWNMNFPELECPWKRNKRIQKSMLKKGTAYKTPHRDLGKAASRLTDYHCPADIALRIEDLSGLAKPDEAQGCTGDSAECMASEYNAELSYSL